MTFTEKCYRSKLKQLITTHMIACQRQLGNSFAITYKTDVSQLNAMPETKNLQFILAK
jgi:hypothetical protein